jgi:hypothetical protein
MTKQVFDKTKFCDLFAYINKLEAEIEMLKERLELSKRSTEALARKYPNA